MSPVKQRGMSQIAMGLGVAILAGGMMTMGACSATAASSQGSRLQAMQSSPQWRDGKFHNTLERHDGSFLKMLGRWIRGAENTVPAEPPPIASTLR